MGPASFRLLLNDCMGMSQEAFVSIVHSNDIAIESVEVRTENEKAILGSENEANLKDTKKGAPSPIPTMNADITTDQYCTFYKLSFI